MPYGAFSSLCRRSLRTTSCWFDSLRLIDVVEQIAHAIGLEPQRQLQLVRRHRLEVVRAIEVGRAVEAGGAGALEQLEMRVARHVLRALEHHVLEQVREARAARRLVRRPDVIPEVDAHERQPTIFGQDHLEAVRQRVFLDVELRNIARRRLRAECQNRQANEEQRADFFMTSFYFVLYAFYFLLAYSPGWPTDTRTPPTDTDASARQSSASA